jgi:hypothetical protein
MNALYRLYHSTIGCVFGKHVECNGLSLYNALCICRCHADPDFQP